MKSKDFGRIVGSQRKKRGWSQAELGERTGISRVTISEIETGQRKISIKNGEYVRLSAELGMPRACDWLDRLKEIS